MTEAARMNAQARPAILSLLAALFIVGPGRADAQAVLDSGRHHLGTAGEPEWDEFAEDAPEGRELVVRFDGKDNTREATLFIRQRDVKLDWPVMLNDRPIGRLQPVNGTQEELVRAGREPLQGRHRIGTRLQPLGLQRLARGLGDSRQAIEMRPARLATPPPLGDGSAQ